MDLKTCLRSLASVVTCTSLIVLIVAYTLLANVLQVVAFGVLSRKTYHELNCLLAYCIWKNMNLIMSRLNANPIDIELVWEGFPDDIPEKESAVLVSNHVAATDFYILNEIALKRGMLGNLRYFLKWIPLYGLGMYLMGMIFLKRSWKSDEKNIKAQLKQFTADDTLPVWLISFVEGSRLSEKKLAEMQAFCKSREVSYVPKHSLIPRSRGFITTIAACREGSAVKYVYDVTLAYWHSTRGWGHFPSLAQINFGVVPPGCKYFALVKRIPISEIPVGHEDQWLKDLFVEKDKYLQQLKTQWESK